MNRHLLHLALMGLALPAISHAQQPILETEPNNSNATANVLVVPSTTNGTGVIVTGKLRAGNVTPSPRDNDQFKFTNTNDFTSFRVKITPSGIDGSQSIRYSILDGDFIELFTDQFSSNFREHTFLAANGANFHIVVEDPGNLSSASGEASYSVEIVGIGSTPFVPSTETEPNNTSGTANNLVVPFTTNDTGVTATGKLRENNQTPNPRDQDFFRFTNPHQFTSMRVKITPSGISGSQSIAYQILNSGQSELFSGNFSSGFREHTISSPAAGAVFFVRVFDPGNLSSESASASYSVEIIGAGGQDPGVLFTNKQAEVAAKQAEVNAKNAEILAIQAEIATVQSWIPNANRGIATAKNGIAKANRSLLQQKKALKRAKSAKQKKAIKKKIAAFSKQLGSFRSQLGSWNSLLGNYNSDLAQHNSDLLSLQQEFSVLQNQLSVLQAELAALQD